MKPIRILIAEDSDLFARVLTSAIEDEPDMELVGLARNGEEAVDLCAELRPDLVLMDIQMPRMDGLTATRHIMGNTPTPILVITSDPFHGGIDLSFKALSAGALDLMPKPEAVPWPEPTLRAFLRKIRLLSQVPVVRHMRGRIRSPVSFHGAEREQLPPEDMAVVGIVASTGGPRALMQILGNLPPQFPAPILVVQHIMAGFSSHLTSWLNRNCALHVREAENGAPIEPGTVYIAPDEHHLEVGSNHEVRLHQSAAIDGHRPSGDLLLESVARRAESRALGLVLSGMGSDGTLGLAAIRRAGGTTLVQDRASSVVYSMPQSAIDLEIVDEVVELERFARRMVELVQRLHRSHL